MDSFLDEDTAVKSNVTPFWSMTLSDGSHSPFCFFDTRFPLRRQTTASERGRLHQA